MKSLIWRYTAFQFFFGLLLWAPIFFEYQKQMGLSVAEILMIQSIYQIVFCLFEIPTGYFADRYGHHRSLVVGSVILTIANALPIFSVSYAGFLAHFTLIALSRSFFSGASSAYLYEALAAQGFTHRYKEIEGLSRSLGLVGRVVCWAGVGFMMEWHVTLPYWLTAFSSLIGFGFALALPREVTHAHRGDARASFFQTASLAWQQLRSNSLLIAIMLQGVAIFVLARAVQVTLYQPILNEKGVSLAYHGTVLSFMTVCEAIGSARPQWLRRWLGDADAVTALTLSLAVSLVAIAQFETWGALLGLCLYSLVAGFSFPIQKQLMNDAISAPGLRATLISVESIIDRGFSALVTLLIAQYMAKQNLAGFLTDSAIATVVVAVLVGAWIRRQKQVAEKNSA